MSWLALGGAVLGSLIGARSSKKAANTQAAAADRATELQREQYNQTRLDNAPTRERGDLAGGRLSDLMGLSKNTGADGYGSLNQRFDGSMMLNEPGYQFGLDQGVQGVQRSAAGRGGLYSGATLKALTRFGNDYASTKYGQAADRFNNDQNTQFNRLSGIAGTGQVATNNVNAAGQSFANNAGNIGMQGADARASGTMGQANAWSQGIGNMMNFYQQQQMLNRLKPNAQYDPTSYYTSGNGGSGD